MAEKYIAVLPGEGVGLEVVPEAVKALRAIAQVYGHKFHFEEGLVGIPAKQRSGSSFPGETRESWEYARDNGGAVLFGSVSGEPLLDLRKDYNLFKNLRPFKVLDELLEISPFRPEIISGVDMLCVRELNGDVYYGSQRNDGEREIQDMHYTKPQVEQIVRVAFEYAMSRRKNLTMVHKSNAIPKIGKLWHDVVADLRPGYSGVDYRYLHVDAAATALNNNPLGFDVIVTTNLFGDIITDQMCSYMKSIGMSPSASLDKNNFGLYECTGGTAPDLIGKGVANPIGTILSAAMMLRLSFGMEAEAKAIEAAVQYVLKTHRTQDIMHPGRTYVNTREMGNLIEEKIMESA